MGGWGVSKGASGRVRCRSVHRTPGAAVYYTFTL